MSNPSSRTKRARRGAWHDTDSGGSDASGDDDACRQALRFSPQTGLQVRWVVGDVVLAVAIVLAVAAVGVLVSIGACDGVVGDVVLVVGAVLVMVTVGVGASICGMVAMWCWVC